MIEKPKLLMLVIILTLSGILGLYGYAVSIEGLTTPISDLDTHIGDLVAVEGYIENITNWYGETSIILFDFISNDTASWHIIGNKIDPETVGLVGGNLDYRSIGA